MSDTPQAHQNDHSGLRKQAGAAVMALLKRFPLAPPDQFGGQVGRLGATEHDVADAVLTVVNPVLEGLRAERDALRANLAKARKALAGHLFDGESLSTRDAIRVELIEQQHAELTRLRKQLSAGETTSSNEYEVRYPPGVALEPEQFNDIRDASNWQQLVPGFRLFQRTVTPSAVKGEWEEVQ